MNNITQYLKSITLTNKELLAYLQEYFIKAYKKGDLSSIMNLVYQLEFQVHEKTKSWLLETIERQFKLLQVKSTLEKTLFRMDDCSCGLGPTNPTFIAENPMTRLQFAFMFEKKETFLLIRTCSVYTNYEGLSRYNDDGDFMPF